MGIFTAKAVPESTKKELDARAKVRATDPWFTSRTTWVHITSMCDQCDDKVKYLTSFLYPSYIDNKAFMGERPNPVVESLQIKALGSLGTTRSCVIKIIAFNQDQLDMLTKCYAVPSMSVRVQFGWNKSANGDLAPGAYGERYGINDSKAICKINKTRNENPIYDGLQGIVGKWSINFVKESMWWEFTLEIVAASSSVLTKPLEDFSSLCYCDRTTTNLDTGVSKVESVATSPFRAYITQAINAASSNQAIQSTTNRNTTQPTNIPNVTSVVLRSEIRNDVGGQPTGFWNTVGSFINNIGTPSTTEAYITFGRLQQLINEYSLSQNTTSKKPLQANFNSKGYGYLSHKKPGWSTDPHVCLFPGVDYGYIGLPIDKNTTCLVKEGDNYSINIDKVLINCIFINKCIDELGKDYTIQDFIQRILDGITTASAGLFELSIVEDGGNCDDTSESEPPTITVIDLQKYKKESKTYSIPAYSSNDSTGPITNSGGGAVLRDVKLELKLTDAMMSQALYAGERKQSNGKPCDNARFEGELKKPVNVALPPRTNITKPKDDCPSTCDGDKQRVKQPAELYAEMKNEITEGKKETLRSALINVYNEGASKDLCKEVIVPYEFSFTLDGIGGLAFSQVVTCDLLPKSNTDVYEYQITSVEHTINYGDWTTTVNTKARYKQS